jgi:hypothetical protein
MSTLMMLGPVAAPALGAVAQAALGWGRVTSWISTLSASAALVAAIGTAIGVTSGGPRTAVAGLMRVDALSAFMLIVIAAAGVLATVATSAYLGVEIRAAHASARTATRHSVLVQLFLASMALAVLAANLGLLWVAVEATTVVTAFLVGHQRSRAAVEAAWKYVVIWSTASRWHYWVRSCSTMPPSTHPGRPGTGSRRAGDGWSGTSAGYRAGIRCCARPGIRPPSATSTARIRSTASKVAACTKIPSDRCTRG